MDDLQLTKVPSSKTGMLIRKPAAEVFEALVNPELTTQFWFTRSSGRLAEGQKVLWEWEMYDASAEVQVRVFEPNTRLVIEWPGYSGPTTVEWILTPYQGDATFVAVSEAGFVGSGDELLQQVSDSTEGFALLLAGLKAFLEHGIRLNLVGDRHPADLEEA